MEWEALPAVIGATLRQGRGRSRVWDRRNYGAQLLSRYRYRLYMHQRHKLGY